MGISTHSLPRRIAIITGDPSLPDPTKHGHRYGAEDLAVHERMREAFAALGKFEFTVIERHEGLFDTLREFAPDLVVNFCDTGLLNNPQHEIHIATQLETMGLPYTGAVPRGMLLLRQTDRAAVGRGDGRCRAARAFRCCRPGNARRGRVVPGADQTEQR